MNKYTAFIYFLIFLKVTFILLSIVNIYLVLDKKQNTTLDKNIVYWKSKLEFVFVFFMSFLIMYLFNPFKKNMVYITTETKVLLFLFAIILLITADYKDFFKQSKMFTELQKVLK